MVVASPPFDTSNADVILRSSDPVPVDFRVHKCLLEMASPTFREMFTLPQPPSKNPNLPVVEVAETAGVIDPLLRFVYPVEAPSINNLTELASLITAADKYEMELVMQSLRKLMVGPLFLKRSPLEVFALAAKLGFEEEASIASSHTLSLDLFHPTQYQAILRHVPQLMLHRLYTLHHTREVGILTAMEQRRPGNKICLNGLEWFDKAHWLKRELMQAKTIPVSDVAVKWMEDSYSAGKHCKQCNGMDCGLFKILHLIKNDVEKLPTII